MVGLLNSGDHILLVNQIYGPAIELVKNLAKNTILNMTLSPTAISILLNKKSN